MDKEWQAWCDEALRAIEPYPEARTRLTDRLRAAGELGFIYSVYAVGGGNRGLKRVLRRLAVEHL